MIHFPIKRGVPTLCTTYGSATGYEGQESKWDLQLDFHFEPGYQLLDKSTFASLSG